MKPAAGDATVDIAVLTGPACAVHHVGWRAGAWSQGNLLECSPMNGRLRVCRVAAVWLVCLSCGAAGEAGAVGTRPTEGLREHTPQVYALVNARIVPAAGRLIEQGCVIVRDGVIEAVGEVPVPPEARVRDLSGKTIYPGLIDAFTEEAVDAATVTNAGAADWNDQVTPQLDVATLSRGDVTRNHKKLRSQGIAARLLAPSGRILKGSSAVVLTNDEGVENAIVLRHAAQHLRLTVSRGRGRSDYPGSPMGAVALARQTFLDADWYRRAWQACRVDPALPQPERNDALDVLGEHLAEQGLFICDASNELFALRADRFAREFALRIAIRGSGHEYKRLAAIRDCGRVVILPVDFPKPPNVATAEAALSTDLDDLLHWDLAPENPARLVEAGVRIALTSHGLDDTGAFLDGVRRAVKRGLPADAALAALTTTPAELLGVAGRLGTIHPGKIASLVVTDGDLFDAKTEVLETWVAGERFELVREPVVDLRGGWTLVAEGGTPQLVMTLEGKPASLKGTIAAAADAKADDDKGSSDDESTPTKLDHLGGSDLQFSCTFSGKDLLGEGVVRLTAVVIREGHALSLEGHLTLADGQRRAFTATRQADDATTGDAEGEEPAEEQPADDQASRASAYAVMFPLGAAGRSSPPEQPEVVLFQNGTIWTSGEAGVLEGASVLVVGGRIQAVGHDLAVPEGAVVVDLAGRHLTPGIIDCHSHMATDGGVNESTQAITAEVRIGDFIDSDDITIYRQLAGGVTTANILHGSANPIGGQNQVIKLRWGALPEEMKFAGAPQGIKFALGENVKQANWGEEFTTRYPQTRMGVEQIMRDALQTARQYRAEWEAWQRAGHGLPPRRDLELEALAEIVEGTRWIHCHSYRQDEILALLRTLDDFGITIGSFQHILEGYKVADAMAEHGAMGSAFADWWAYKFEVFDAIPYAGALMHNAGVVVSFNSDDRELGRHLNQEAAKAVKYGGVPAEEALKFVTLNPAKQLRIDERVGSLEAGKDADLVVWSGPPLAITSRVEQTWIDGCRTFDLEDDRQMRQRDAEIRTSLVQKILDSGEKMAADGDTQKDESELWPREDIFCHGHVHGHGEAHLHEHATE